MPYNDIYRGYNWLQLVTNYIVLANYLLNLLAETEFEAHTKSQYHDSEYYQTIDSVDLDETYETESTESSHEPNKAMSLANYEVSDLYGYEVIISQ